MHQVKKQTEPQFCVDAHTRFTVQSVFIQMQLYQDKVHVATINTVLQYSRCVDMCSVHHNIKKRLYGKTCTGKKNVCHKQRV